MLFYKKISKASKAKKLLLILAIFILVTGAGKKA